MKKTVPQTPKTVKTAHATAPLRISCDFPQPLAARLQRVSAYEMKTPQAIMLIGTKSFIEMAEEEMKNARGF